MPEEPRHEVLTRVAATLTAAFVKSVRTLANQLNSSYAPTVWLNAARSILDLGVKLRSLVVLKDRLLDCEDCVKQSLPQTPPAGGIPVSGRGGWTRRLDRLEKALPDPPAGSPEWHDSAAKLGHAFRVRDREPDYAAATKDYRNLKPPSRRRGRADARAPLRVGRPGRRRDPAVFGGADAEGEVPPNRATAAAEPGPPRSRPVRQSSVVRDDDSDFAEDSGVTHPAHPTGHADE